MGRIVFWVSKKNIDVLETLNGRNISEHICKALRAFIGSPDNPDVASYHKTRFNGKSLYDSYMAGELSGQDLLDIQLTHKALAEEFSDSRMAKLLAEISSMYLRQHAD